MLTIRRSTDNVLGFLTTEIVSAHQGINFFCLRRMKEVSLLIKTQQCWLAVLPLIRTLVVVESFACFIASQWVRIEENLLEALLLDSLVLACSSCGNVGN